MIFKSDCLNTYLHEIFYKNKPDFIPATATLTSSSDVKAATAELQELVSFWQTSSTEKSKVNRHKNMFRYTFSFINEQGSSVSTCVIFVKKSKNSFNRNVTYKI